MERPFFSFFFVNWDMKESIPGQVQVSQKKKKKIILVAEMAA